MLSRVCKAAKSALCCLRAVKVRHAYGKKRVAEGPGDPCLHQLRGLGSGDALAALALLHGVEPEL